MNMIGESDPSRFDLVTLVLNSESPTAGVRGAIHAAVKRRGIDPTPLDPWFFPNPEEYTQVSTGLPLQIPLISSRPPAQLLIKHGFVPKSTELFSRPTKLPTDLRGWLVTFARNSFLSSFDDAEAEKIMGEVVDELRADCMDYKGKWEVMYVRLRVIATVA